MTGPLVVMAAKAEGAGDTIVGFPWSRSRVAPVTVTVVLAHVLLAAALSSLSPDRLKPPAVLETVIQAQVLPVQPVTPPEPKAVTHPVVRQSLPTPRSAVQTPSPHAVTPATVVPTAAVAVEVTSGATSPTVMPPPRPTLRPEEVATAAPALASPAPVAAKAAESPTSAVPPGSSPPVGRPEPALAEQLLLPSSDAAYLKNPAPVYPRASRRLGEQGTVVLRVLISLDGRADQVDVRISSGFPRLDEVAMQTVRQWRFVPGRRNGVPEVMAFNVPIRFVLD